MDFLRLPCNSCTSLYRQLSSPKTYNHRFSSLKCRRDKTTSELQTQTGRAGNNNNNFSPSIPTHKVTVHDRQRGVVHEFLVPEVRNFSPPCLVPENTREKALRIQKMLNCVTLQSICFCLLTRIIPVFFFFFLRKQDQYILHTAESQNVSLPFACRHGIVL